MKIFFLALMCISTSAGFAQPKSFDIAVSYGAYYSPSFKLNERDEYYAVDFDYHLTERWTVSSGFLRGRFRYYDDVRSNAPAAVIYTRGNTNARGIDLHAYGMAKYSVIAAKVFTVQLGAGIGLLTQRLEYPYREQSGRGDAFIMQRTTSNIEFPLSAEAYYSIKSRLGIGLKVGSLFRPNYPVVGIHLGPQLRLRL